MQGFASSKTGQTMLPAQVLADATHRIFEPCIDRPGKKLLSVFKRVRTK